jgi:hypothetical protein
LRAGQPTNGADATPGGSPSTPLESIHARAESRTAKVDHSKNSEQTQRWLATALDLEPRLRRIRNYRALPLLREAIKRQTQGVKKSAGKRWGRLPNFNYDWH